MACGTGGWENAGCIMLDRGANGQPVREALTLTREGKVALCD
jgi:hypothetical protein